SSISACECSRRTDRCRHIGGTGRSIRVRRVSAGCRDVQARARSERPLLRSGSSPPPIGVGAIKISATQKISIAACAALWQVSHCSHLSIGPFALPGGGPFLSPLGPLFALLIRLLR